MYCPKCAAANPDQAHFCRSCGLDLSVVARAMEKHLPHTLLRKIDSHLSNRKAIKRRDSILEAVVGIVLLIIAVLSVRYDSWQSAAVFFAMAVINFLVAGWNYLIFVRSRSETKMFELEESRNSSEILSIFGNEKDGARELPKARETEKITARIPHLPIENTTELLPALKQKNSAEL